MLVTGEVDGDWPELAPRDAGVGVGFGALGLRGRGSAREPDQCLLPSYSSEKPGACPGAPVTPSCPFLHRGCF